LKEYRRGAKNKKCRSGLVPGPGWLARWLIRLHIPAWLAVELVAFPFASFASYIGDKAPPPFWTQQGKPVQVMAIPPPLPSPSKPTGWIVGPEFNCSRAEYKDYVKATLVVQNLPDTLTPWLFAEDRSNPGAFYPSDAPIPNSDGTYRATVGTGRSRNYDLHLAYLDENAVTTTRGHVAKRKADSRWADGMEWPKGATIMRTEYIGRTCESLLDVRSR
jgi:hypothetical protein